jgi:predicted pyridoxine 5'-phosphate oxidase superfamily flavin-nucleotide-binding protein
MLMLEDLKKFLLNKGFVSAGTCDLKGQPNAAPKYVIKIEGGFIYLADYVMGLTFRNLKINPRISISTLDIKTLQGWVINGTVKIITKGPQYKKLLKAMAAQEVRHSARRIIEDVKGLRNYDSYEMSFPEKVVIFKVKCEKITKIGIDGKLQVDVSPLS